MTAPATSTHHERKERRPSPALSVQLASVYAAIGEDLPGTIGRIADIGFEHVELFDFVARADEYQTALRDHDLRAETGHAFLLTDHVQTPNGVAIAVPTLEDTFAAARELGVKVVIDPYVAGDRWTSRADVKRTAAQLQDVAAQAASWGLQIGYHNHDHEFRSMIDGQRAYDVLLDHLDPSIVLELDLYWATAAGADVKGTLRRAGDRVTAVHAKDGPMRAGISTNPLPDDQRPLGQGDVDIAGALNAADRLRFVVIEFDQYAGDIFDGITESFRWLRAHYTQELSA